MHIFIDVFPVAVIVTLVSYLRSLQAPGTSIEGTRVAGWQRLRTRPVLVCFAQPKTKSDPKVAPNSSSRTYD